MGFVRNSPCIRVHLRLNRRFQERRTILQLRNQDVINDEVLRRIQRDIDLAEARLLSHR